MKAQNRKSYKKKSDRKSSVTSNASSKSCLTVGEDASPFRPLFDGLFEGSVNKKIDPFCCIPFANIRDVSQSGVQRLISLFDDTYNHKDDTPSTGLALGSDIPIVVELNGALLSCVQKYFVDQGKSGEEINELLHRHKHWYGIVDGMHHNMAVRWLKRNKKQWESFLWYVTIVKGGHSVHEYEKLARFQNHRHSPKYYVEVTLYDQLKNLRKDYDRMRLLKQSVSQRTVAQSYFGFNGVNRTMTMLASVAIRLPEQVIRELGYIMNTDYPKICLKEESIDCSAAKTEEEVMSNQDCRVFRSFLKLNSLYCSKAFMNHSSEHGVDAQVNTLYRLKNLYSMNGYNCIQSDTVTEQYKIAVEALQEERKFLDYLELDSWPKEMDTVRNNLLRTTSMDDEILLNRGNDLSVLDSLRETLQRIDPQMVDRQDEKLRQKQFSQECRENESPEQNLNSSEQREQLSPSPEPTDKTEQPVKSFQEIQRIQMEEDRIRLKSKGIECFNMSWECYIKSHWTDDNEKVDLVISEPPSSPSRSPIHSIRTSKRVSEEITLEESTKLPTSLKRVLSPGGYAVIIMPFDMFMEWYTSFYNAGYEIMPSPYILSYNSETIQFRHTRKFPQIGYQVALIARLPSSTQNRFNPDFNSMFNLVNCSNSRNCAVMFNILKQSSKLYKEDTRIPFHPDELSPHMLAELIDMFTPQGGTVMDIFSGTMTAAIASIQTGRSCICIERDANCFNAAFHRLRLHLPPSADGSLQKDGDDPESAAINNISIHAHGTEPVSLKTDHIRSDFSEKEPSTEKESCPDTASTAPLIDEAFDILNNAFEQEMSPIDNITLGSKKTDTNALENDAKLLLSAANISTYTETSVLTNVKSSSSNISRERKTSAVEQRKGCKRHSAVLNTADLNNDIEDEKAIKRSKLISTRTPLFGNKRVSLPIEKQMPQSQDEVILMMDGKYVGFATLLLQKCAGTSYDSYVTTLHNQNLKKWQDKDQFLVTVHRVRINEFARSLSNPYAFNIGVEDSPRTLGEISPAGVYPWDLKMMKTNKDLK